MKKVCAFTSRYNRSVRMVAAIVLFVAGVASQWFMLANATEPQNDVWTLCSLLVAILFAAVILPIVVSILNDDQEAAGIGPLCTY
ncbi:MAG: hypothetical protein KBD06_02030 [Candidatus Pacebacteria bacterium]|nr:hypothetical protein [Candidatus Paceibacterota bacterium]